MIIKAIKNAARKYKEKQDQKYYDEMKETVEKATDKELKKLNMDFHHGIAMDLKMGNKIPKIIYRVQFDDKIDIWFDYEIMKYYRKTNNIKKED